MRLFIGFVLGVFFILVTGTLFAGCDDGDTTIITEINCVDFPPGHDNCPCDSAEAALVRSPGDPCEEESLSGASRSGFAAENPPERVIRD